MVNLISFKIPIVPIFRTLIKNIFHRLCGYSCHAGCACVWRCPWCRSWDSYIHGKIFLIRTMLLNVSSIIVALWTGKIMHRITGNPFANALINVNISYFVSSSKATSLPHWNEDVNFYSVVISMLLFVLFCLPVF